MDTKPTGGGSFYICKSSLIKMLRCVEQACAVYERLLQDGWYVCLADCVGADEVGLDLTYLRMLRTPPFLNY